MPAHDDFSLERRVTARRFNRHEGRAGAEGLDAGIFVELARNAGVRRQADRLCARDTRGAQEEEAQDCAASGERNSKDNTAGRTHGMAL
jgi:hypothetical protein